MSGNENGKDQTAAGSQQVELLLENGITLGFVDQDSRVIQVCILFYIYFYNDYLSVYFLKVTFFLQISPEVN